MTRYAPRPCRGTFERHPKTGSLYCITDHVGSKGRLVIAFVDDGEDVETGVRYSFVLELKKPKRGRYYQSSAVYVLKVRGRAVAYHVGYASECQEING